MMKSSTEASLSKTFKYEWCVPGDINGFFGLMFDNGILSHLDYLNELIDELWDRIGNVGPARTIERSRAAFMKMS